MRALVERGGEAGSWRRCPSAARRWRRSMRRISRACFIASPARSASPAATSSTRAFTRPRDGMALDNFLIQDQARRPLRRPASAQAARGGDRAGAGRRGAGARTAGGAGATSRRAAAFTVRPAVFIDDAASSRYTVVEVNAQDRAGLAQRSRARDHALEGDDPQRPYRHLWRARRRRLLSDRSWTGSGSRGRRG